MVSTADDLQAACYHEAGHAVFAYHAGYRLRSASAAAEEHPDLCRHDFPARASHSDMLKSLLISLAGPYAEHRAAHDEPMRHHPYAFLQECAGEDARDLEAGLYETPSDCINALKVIQLSATEGEASAEDPKDVEERIYSEACRQVAAHVEEFWPEIEAVAEKLLEVGYLEGEEVGRMIEGVRR